MGAGRRLGSRAGRRHDGLRPPTSGGSRRPPAGHRGGSAPRWRQDRGERRPLRRPAADDPRPAHHIWRGDPPVVAPVPRARRAGPRPAARCDAAAAPRTPGRPAGLVVPPARDRGQAGQAARRDRPPRRPAVGLGAPATRRAGGQAVARARSRAMDRRPACSAPFAATTTPSSSATTTSRAWCRGTSPARPGPTTTACSTCSNRSAASAAESFGLLGIAGRRPPAFGPRRRILPMYRW